MMQNNDNTTATTSAVIMPDDELLRFLLELGIDSRTDEYLRQLARLAAHAASVDDIARQLKARSDTLNQREQQLHQVFTQHEQHIAEQVATVNAIAQQLTARMEQQTTSPPAPQPQQNQQIINDRYRDLGDGTVLDIKTNLQWMRCALGQTWDGKTCVGEAAEFNWNDAHATAEKVHFAGFNDWRLPTKDELLTLVIEAIKPTIDQQTFPNAPSMWFWSGSPNADYSNLAWGVDFDDGVAYGNHRSSSYHVRLVRVGQ